MPVFLSVKNTCLQFTAFVVTFTAIVFSHLAFSAGVITNTDVSAEIRINSPHRYADVFLDTDRYSGSFTLNIKQEHVGTEGELYLVAIFNNDQQFMKTESGWRRWDGTLSGLQAMTTRTLLATEELSLLDNGQLLAGTYRINAAYRSGDKLIINPTALQFDVSASSVETLIPFTSEEAMLGYLKEGMQSSSGTSFVSRSTAVAFADDASSASSSVRVSTTNLQETDVDEADTIKTDGNNLFMLANCEQQVCLDVYDLDSGQADANLIESHALEQTVAPDGMYLIQDEPGSDLLVTVGGKNNYVLWLDVWGWGGNTTEIEFFDANQPDSLVSLEKLSIDGALISSRRVGNTLFVATRFSPYIPEYIPQPLDTEQEQENEVVLAETAFEDLVPRIRDSQENAFNLVTPDDCYLPVSAVDRTSNPSIITITSIPLDNPTSFQSTCFLGGTEAFYMSSESLYLATTQYDYQFLGRDALIYSPNHTTTVHKFSLDSGAISYRGSGNVEGHLGWSEDKKSFRMGENGDYLNIVTSVGDTWNETSSTQLTVLKESTAGNTLEQVALVEGIGKPGEQLYAARFIGERAYLVTFRVIDPLYVVDLANQESPQIVGELEIAGYSDYLHPVSETLLLGIGKDAIADEGSFDFGGTRGAWYQGVKLSLFDVSDPSAPVELDALVLGERGTESTVLWDHHALSFLPSEGGEPARIAIPVQLHESVPDWKGWDAEEPSAWYDFTHTGLYTFEITGQGLSQAGRIVSKSSGGDDFVIALDDDDVLDKEDDDQGDTETTRPVEIPDTFFAPIFNFYNDRSVLLEDAVFYIHEGEVLTSFWGENIGTID